MPWPMIMHSVPVPPPPPWTAVRAVPADASRPLENEAAVRGAAVVADRMQPRSGGGGGGAAGGAAALVMEQARRAQACGAMALIVVNGSDDDDEPWPVGWPADTPAFPRVAARRRRDGGAAAASRRRGGAGGGGGAAGGGGGGASMMRELLEIPVRPRAVCTEMCTLLRARCTRRQPPRPCDIYYIAGCLLRARQLLSAEQCLYVCRGPARVARQVLTVRKSGGEVLLAR
jgi:hypothetical protein